ncbi:hypothetical protein GCM10020358_83090 [Amorphoplanes nipponensis]|nr:hypothetical protein [Actinoplanes nipponensis]
MRRVVTWARTVGVAGALLAGALGSAAAVRLSGFPGPPAEADAVAAAVTAIGQRPLDRPGPVVVCDFFCPEDDGDGVVSYDSAPDRTDVVTVTYELSGTSAPAVEARARDRLAAAGWRADRDGDLTRDGLAVGLQIADAGGGVRATVVASKLTSPLAGVLAVAGFLLGAALGGLLVRLAHRRFRRHGPAVSLVAGAPAVVVTALTLGYAAMAVLMTAHDPRRPGVQLAEFLLTVFPSVSLAVGGAALLALALVALPPRPGPAGLRLGRPVGHTGGHGAARS